MRFSILPAAALVGLLTAAPLVLGDESPLPQSWDYTARMKTVAARFRGRPGVVLHIGDSITYASPYGQWARTGAGQTEADRDLLAWMHSRADDDTDGWWLARFDLPEGGRSYTAAGGLRADELLAGGKKGLPPLKTMLEKYHPQIAVLMIGTNDAAGGRPLAPYRRDVEAAVDLMLEQGTICILSTIPPYYKRLDQTAAYNKALRDLARDRGLPLIDFEQEILSRRPEDWNGTLLRKDDAHPSASVGPTSPGSAPTAENLRNSGYLLRGWLSVRKIGEVKRAVLDAPAPPEASAAPPPAALGPETKLAVTRDTWFSNAGSEREANLGGASRLKLKSYQEFSLFDVDTQALRGRVVRQAVLHVRSLGEPRLRRVTVGSFGASWVEGTSPSYAPQPGSSSFNHRRNPDVPWTVAGSDLTSVILGQGGTDWRMADASSADPRGWQQVVVDPSIVAARVAGTSEGFLLFDDTGAVWSRQGEKFTIENFPNRYIHSRESGPANAPYLTVVLGEEDHQPPSEPREMRTVKDDLPAGEATVSWLTPRDLGPAGTIGFFVTVAGKEVPRYLIPRAAPAGEPVRMHLRDLGLEPGATVALSVRAVDGAGNVGTPAEAMVRLSDRAPRPLPAGSQRPATTQAPLPRLGGAEVAIVDELDKVQPATGAMIPAQAEGYLAANHLWEAASKQVRLHAARNEFVGFQVLLKGPAGEVRPRLTFTGLGSSAIAVEFGRYHLVESKKGLLPDPIVPLDFAGERAAGSPTAGYSSLHGEIYVPHDAAAGEHRGTLTLTSGGEILTLPVALRVWDFTLPDALSFLPDMNCYGLPTRDERDFYRLAHKHRTVLNKVPYSQRGIVEDGCAPTWDGRRLDWTAWDRRFAAYFDGSAFADLPRKGVPIECFYLPLNENWPDPVESNYNGDYWADRAFPPSYRRDFVEVSRQMAEHFQARGWKGTFFQCFFNGKNDFKTRGWSRGSSPWLLDEPAHFQDFWALRYFAAAFHEGVRKAPGPARLVFRADISRPQWQRDSLDGLLDYNVVGGAFRPYRRLVLDRKQAQGELVVEYGTTNAVEEANVQPVGWSLDAWSLGSDGVLPWQTVGNAASWRRADTLSLFYPAPGGGAPLPSIRLKAFRRGEQDVEYLTLYAQATAEPRWAVGQAVREALHLAGERKGTGFAGGEDAGRIHYAKLLPQDAWALRVRIGEALSVLHPAPRHQLVDLRTPPRDPSRLSPGYARGADR